jgi:phosphoglycolate phosphatase
VIASTSEAVAEAILPYSLDQNKDALIARMTAASSGTPQVQVSDLKSLFANLKKRRLKLGVATNDAEEPARENLSQADVSGLFDFIAGFDSGYGAKPAPGQLLAFCEQVGLASNQCVMVGDSLHDLHAGRAAGMRTVGVLTGPAQREELAPFADVVLATIAELPEWLDQFEPD